MTRKFSTDNVRGVRDKYQVCPIDIYPKDNDIDNEPTTKSSTHLQILTFTYSADLSKKSKIPGNVRLSLYKKSCQTYCSIGGGEKKDIVQSVRLIRRHLEYYIY